ncbi:hypothetical protein ABEF92_004773 [Exophiala dermatitidis]|uniref:Uncharacterized protein n=1 Tax=Exophiala dermatitidis (strain ATCC 34100 / CBS 525.76 / NIH/UT8656) TaxID=858893 RepID=H6BML3_EXODN|nr:uncharacterized protein HMPREF1120_01241 [Exophiala dermatitidis NIH/UT8656]EHY53040.1 hypothetical protein HMPREF1120_01241 [Exophiala dermatitidis NIH/UT8656]
MQEERKGSFILNLLATMTRSEVAGLYAQGTLNIPRPRHEQQDIQSEVLPDQQGELSRKDNLYGLDCGCTMKRLFEERHRRNCSGRINRDPGKDDYHGGPGGVQGTGRTRDCSVQLYNLSRLGV